MPTKRRRRVREPQGLTVEEREWLTGEALGGSKLWRFRIGPDQLERCRELMRTHADLIPRGRHAELEADLRLWTPPKPSGLSSFR